MKKMKLVLLLVAVFPLTTLAKDYKASLFGILSDGVTDNTRSIQKAIDFINENGGGRLVFYVGRYLTGTVALKSNVCIKLEEGAVLVGAPSIYSYSDSTKIKALITADGQKNIGISGKGVIDGQGSALRQNIAMLQEKRFVTQRDFANPALMAFINCSYISIDSVNLWNGCGKTQLFDHCDEVRVENVNITSKQPPGAAGILVRYSANVAIKDSFIDVPQDPPVEAIQSTNLKVERTVNPMGKNIGQ
ncbi:MAG: endopygalactorunase [Niabella sp.]|nr:endopygalactorunase [Niabella sp.]